MSSSRNERVQKKQDHATKCPHCVVSFWGDPQIIPLAEDRDGSWYVVFQKCPSCVRLIVKLERNLERLRPINLGAPEIAAEVDVVEESTAPTAGLRELEDEYGGLVWPRVPSRSPIPTEVPEMFAEDYREACLVLADSPKASAALSRRCLQLILREKAKVKHGDLHNEIKEVIGRNDLPSDIAESIDFIRNIGNFAAHPRKSASTSEIVPVELGEAEWCLDVIEMLYEFYFVRPAMIEEKRRAINEKLDDSGRPTMKSQRRTT